MKSITAVCVLKSGGRYKSSDVANLKYMLEQHVTVPYTFVCLTDVPEVMHICRAVSLLHNFKGYWSKIELFRPDLFDTDRVIYFDLDKLILGNIDDLFTQTNKFIALRPFNPKNSKRPNYFASAIMAWDNDSRFSSIYKSFIDNPVFWMSRFQGDQDYLSFSMSLRSDVCHAYWQDLVGGIYSYKRHYKVGKARDARIICFHGRPHHTDVDTESIIAECNENISRQ